ncbi:3-phosphoinositide-dependent protein kinase 1-related [Anaeramoeba flamelloides]|uniref:non-specific serine/threonine protein kinase n=1 Tax=Anaeramoeba flamelloides TaxID=1746091 RepID=A0ABQ8XDE4_9EUKA|nr:3-phosphoinositide-dependent protein kinase 1-related [Anaeramoeba flamelloides]
MTDLNSTSEDVNNQLVFSSDTSTKLSPLLTKKEKKQNRSEIEMNNYIFSQKLGTVVVLRNTILEELTYGNTAVSNTTQLKPQDSGLKLEELPIEAIWGIFEYLPPIKLGWMGTLCKKFQEATNDNMLWQIISKRHQNLFIWDKLRIGDEHNTSHNTPIYGTLDTLTKLPKTQVNEIIGESDFRGVQPITNLTERITYIEKLENAKEHMIKKIIEIKKINKLKQEYIIRKEIRQREFDIKEDFFHESYKVDIYRVTYFLAFTLTSFYILLDLSKNKIISEAYIMLPFQISWFIYLVTFTYTLIPIYVLQLVVLFQTIGNTIASAFQLKNFKFGKVIGRGSFGDVHEATHQTNNTKYAIKVMNKRHIVRVKKQHYVSRERNILQSLDSQFIIKLYACFQDTENLYMITELCQNGELHDLIRKYYSIDLEPSRFIIGQIVLALEYLHSKNIVHRDLKPENILITKDMKIKLCDFGTANILPEKLNEQDNQNEKENEKENDNGNGNGNENENENSVQTKNENDKGNENTKKSEKKKGKKFSFAGTAEYSSPEMLKDKIVCKESDLWALGCIIFQIFAGKPPFQASNDYLIFQKILKLDYNFPEAFPEEARDIVEQLLVIDPEQRLGANSNFEELKSHTFFENLDFSNLPNMKTPKFKSYAPRIKARKLKKKRKAKEKKKKSKK